MVQVAGLLATGWMVWCVSIVPGLARFPFRAVISMAVQQALFACTASVAITVGLYLLIARSTRREAFLAALRSSSTAVWFAPAALLLSTLSPLFLAAALVLIISATRLLYVEWRAIHPAPSFDGTADRELFEPPPKRRPQDLAPALVASLGLQASAVALLTSFLLLAAALFSLGLSMLTFSALASGAYVPQTQRTLPRSILGLGLTVILAAAMIVSGVAGRGSRGLEAWPAQPHRGVIRSARALLERLLNSNEQEQPRGSVTTVYARPSSMGNVEIDDKSFPGVVLWSQPKPQTKLVQPPPSRAFSSLPAVSIEPSVIPFSGEYWMFRPPDNQPPRKSYSRFGNPLSLSFLTTDHAVMSMEAHQRLEHSIDLSCCGEIQIAISNADRFPGTVELELILMDGEKSQSLGRARVPYRPDAVLHFSIPSNSTIQQFNELKIVFQRDHMRIDHSARISIERFVLTPRSF